MAVDANPGKPAGTAPLVEVTDVTVSIPTYTSSIDPSIATQGGILRRLLFSRRQRELHTILSGVSFSLEAGDRLGVQGVNGAGKSTLLRTIAGVYRPTRGSVVVRGTIGSLFDVNLGFHPLATGTENIFLRGFVMGMTAQQIREKMPEVRAFTELGSDLDKPFQTYSQGMRLRLAVAVSTLIEPDVLIIDEWIGAADASFRPKVTERLNSIIGRSKVLIIASHNDALLQQLCNKFIVLTPQRDRRVA